MDGEGVGQDPGGDARIDHGRLAEVPLRIHNDEARILERPPWTWGLAGMLHGRQVGLEEPAEHLLAPRDFDQHRLAAEPWDVQEQLPAIGEERMGTERMRGPATLRTQSVCLPDRPSAHSPLDQAVDEANLEQIQKAEHGRSEDVRGCE